MVVIPQSLRRQKLMIWRSVTLLDLALLTLYAATAFGLSYGLISLGTAGQVVIGLMVFAALCCTFIRSPSQNLKFYELLFYGLLFVCKKKKYPKTSLNGFYRLVKMKRNGAFEAEANTLGSKTKSRTKCHSLAIRLTGFNIGILDETKQDINIEALQRALNSLEINFDLVKINEPPQLSSVIASYIDAYVATNENPDYTPRQKLPRLKLLQRKIEHFTEGGAFDYDTGIKFYLVVHGKSEQEAEDIAERALGKFRTAGIKTQKCDWLETLNLLRKLARPTLGKLDERKGEKHLEFPNGALARGKLRFAPDFAEFGNKKAFSRVGGIYGYPITPNFLWLSNILKIPGEIVIKSKFVPRDQAARLFHRANMNLRAGMGKGTKYLQGMEIEHAMEAMDTLAENVAARTDNIRFTHILFRIVADTPKKLDAEAKRIAKYLRDEQYMFNHFKFRQEDAHAALIPDGDIGLFGDMTELPNSAFAWGFPFTSDGLEDERGFYIGKTDTNNALMFDRFRLDTKRKNHNLFALGASGAGKTVFFKRMILNDLLLNRRVIAVDIEREYMDMCKRFDGD